MSLISFMKNTDVREKFVQQFPKPKFTLKKEILAPPKTKRYSLVGTAFDYLLRFYIKHHNPHAVTKPWGAEHALASPFLAPDRLGMGDKIKNMSVINIDTGGFIEVIWVDDTYKPVPFKGLALKISQTINQAKSVYNDYLASGQMTDEVIRNGLLLAQLDYISRSVSLDENIGQIDDDDVADLRELISHVKPELFVAKELCVLNPTFGKASTLVGGADADILIDNVLIDIKTSKDLQFSRDFFLQIMGYYVLSRIGNINNDISAEINELGIYYARYGELFTFSLQDIVDEKTLPQFLEWFKQRASE